MLPRERTEHTDVIRSEEEEEEEEDRGVCEECKENQEMKNLTTALLAKPSESSERIPRSLSTMSI